MIYDIFINCNWVVTRWQYIFTHKQYIEQHNNRTTQIQTNVEECGPCPVFVSFTLAFALQLRKKHGKTSVRLRKTSFKVQYRYYQKHPHITKPSQTHTLQNPLIHSHTHTHTTKQYKTTIVQIKTKCLVQIKGKCILKQNLQLDGVNTLFNSY
jgi:hypothetical protein